MIFIVVLVGLIAILFIFRKKDVDRNISEFPLKWREILLKEVSFYKKLNTLDRSIFEERVQLFLKNKKITGIQTEITDEDCIFIASGAIIPLFRIGEFYYPRLNEILVYPEHFNTNYDLKGEDRDVLGLVGAHGIMNGTMILSQKALRQGFRNAKDGRNVVIHEFIHLIDGADSSMDGLPEVLLEHQYTIPFMKIVKEEIDNIHQGKSDINPYGGTSDTEFFAVVSELFFENPRKLEKDHPELFSILKKLFKVNENY
ncbi:MAG: zinc-dependent peptidase [Crocinitomicaceae bacterium]|nr:zinc-dependent peptidase [Crocinitomicaceae bacterium]